MYIFTISAFFQVPEYFLSNESWLYSGANDGLVSVAALMVGVGGGSSDITTMRLAGLAGLVGGALSMACGEYISVSSQRDSEEADVEKERIEQLKGPRARAHELEELAQIYEDRGISKELARQVCTCWSKPAPSCWHPSCWHPGMAWILGGSGQYPKSASLN